MHFLLSRYDQWLQFFPQADPYRWHQVNEALFFPQYNGWEDVMNLPLSMRVALKTKIPWTSYRAAKIVNNAKHDTVKALLDFSDGASIETVLMEHARGKRTICVSSQVGCAMACRFCATGQMGISRNLLSDEIVDQFRFWTSFLLGRSQCRSRISNIVFMGMGEPLANYDSVKSAIRTLLQHTDIGPTHITVSTVGILLVMERLLDDSEWPAVRVAISLHSADLATRKMIVPTTQDDFFSKLESCSKTYLNRHGSRRHHLSFEYVMLSGVNDTMSHARKLAEYAQKIGRVRINLIPYNVTNALFSKSEAQTVKQFSTALEKRGVIVTVRKTMGDDISAACGQLTVGAIR